MKRSVAVAGAVVSAALALSLASCREIDKGAVDAVKVEGSDGLYRFCDGPTLIYFEDVPSGDDEVQAIWPGLCEQQHGGKWEYSTTAASRPRENGNPPDGGDR